MAKYAKKANIAVVIPDTAHSQRVGLYLDSAKEPSYNMFSYVSKELPETVEKYFPVSQTQRSITGFGTGGNGAITVSIKRPGFFRSVSALSPLPLTHLPNSV